MAITLGALYEVCKDQNNLSKQVKFDFGAFPLAICSWRGAYDEPTLTNSQEPITAAELVTVLEEALIHKKEFRGYKGGYFSYTADQLLWSDPYGMCLERHISEIQVLEEENTILLLTSFESPDYEW